MLQEEDGWPVAKYVGACGRVVVEEYAGEMLTLFHNAPWLQRAHFAYQLLIAAHNFTDSHPYFGFYLTDVSADNIAVDARGRVRFVDLENVIVLDRNVPDEGALMFVLLLTCVYSMCVCLSILLSFISNTEVL